MQPPHRAQTPQGQHQWQGQRQQQHAARGAPAQDEPCDMDAAVSLLSPGYEDMPQLINASPDPLLMAPWAADPFSISLGQRSVPGGSEPSLIDLNDDYQHVLDPVLDPMQDNAGHGDLDFDRPQHNGSGRDHAAAAAAGVAAAAARLGSSMQQRRIQQQQQQQQRVPFDLQLTDLFTPFGRPLGPMLWGGGASAGRSRHTGAAGRAAGGTAAAAPAAPPAPAAEQHAMLPPGTRRVWRRTGRVMALVPPAGDDSHSPSRGLQQQQHQQQQQRPQGLAENEELLDYDEAEEFLQQEQQQQRQGLAGNQELLVYYEDEGEQQQDQDQEHMQDWEQDKQQLSVPPCKLLRAEDCRMPGSCSFLLPGSSFVGVQKLGTPDALEMNQWSVRVVLHEVDLARGQLSGSMQAFDVAGSDGPIDTFFEGTIIDDVHHTFWTQSWGASNRTDLRHWSRFPGFAALRPLVVRNAGRCGVLDQQPLIFMRWKERFFVNRQADCGLTIAGFYYVALDRRTGLIKGFYFDPASSPFQQLDMQIEHTHSGSGSGGGGSSTGRSSTGGSRGSSSTGGSRGSNASSDGGLSFASCEFA